ncbi:MAG: DUF1924 domain-containing protein [Gammaproteobacteria bacterium]|nr:DUF1924 domain-containing protein [Gammaproteobacteria bacterium]
MRRHITVLVVLTGLSVIAPASIAAPADFLKTYEAAARQEAPGFAGFSAQRGAAFYKTTHGREWSCASCHTQNPAASGRHAKTDKPITPLAPAANAKRFARADKVEKWFRRNCNDVLGRECTAREKGDVLAYLMSVKK